MSNQKSPPRIKPTIKSAPKPSQIYWCDLPEDAQLPEFWKRRPVLVLSAKAKLHGIVTVIPLSTKAQPKNPYAHKLKLNKGGKHSWAICNHILTLAVSRLLPHSRHGIPKIDDADFQQVLWRVHQSIPQPRLSND